MSPKQGHRVTRKAGIQLKKYLSTESKHLTMAHIRFNHGVGGREKKKDLTMAHIRFPYILEGMGVMDSLAVFQPGPFPNSSPKEGECPWISC